MKIGISVVFMQSENGSLWVMLLFYLNIAIL